MLQGPTNILKSHQTQQYAKYGSNLMEHFFKFLFSFWGVLGKRILNPEVLKCHEDIITLDTWRGTISFTCTVFHEYLAGIIFSEFVILEISRVFNLAIPKNRAVWLNSDLQRS